MSAAEIQLWIVVASLVILILGILLWPILLFKNDISTKREDCPFGAKLESVFDGIEI